MIKSALLTLMCFILLGSCSFEKLDAEIDASQEPSQLQEIMKNSAEDVALHPEVKAYLDPSIEPIWQDNAYIYGRGMDIKTDDVYKTGLEIAKMLLKINKNYDYEMEYDDGFLNDFKKIDFPNNVDFCNLSEIDCFNEILHNFPQKLESANRYMELQIRYQTFIAFKYFSNPVLWTLDSNFSVLPYSILTSGLKVTNILRMNKLMRGEKESIIDQLYSEATDLKRLLAQADSLIAKMVFVYMYSEHLAFVNASLAMKWLTIEDIKGLKSLETLNGDELSTQKAWLNEEKVKMRMLQKTIHKDQVDNVLVDTFYPELPAKMVKPNLILNTLYFEYVMPLIGYMNLLPDEYFAGLEKFNIKIDFDEVENPVGTLFNVSADQVKEKYLQYQARLFSLNMKIQLMRALVEQGSFEKVIKKTNEGHKAYLNHFDQSLPVMDESNICYSGIFEGNKDLRCLNIIKPN